MESAPRNIQVGPLSSSTMMITWEPPEKPNGQVTVSYVLKIPLNIIVQIKHNKYSRRQNISTYLFVDESSSLTKGVNTQKTEFSNASPYFYVIISELELEKAA